MSNVVNLNYWDDSLCFQLNNNDSSICDFNRFLYKGFPSTKDIKHGNSVSYKDRKDIASQFKDCFKEKINEGASHDTLYSLYIETSRYLKWCDQNNSEAFKQSSLEGYFDSLLERVNLGTLKRNTYTNKLSCMSMVFKDYLNLPSQWFLNVTSAGKGDKESFEAYSRRDLKTVTPSTEKTF